MKAASDVGAAVLQRLGGHFYESMVFHLVDSSSYRCFMKLGLSDPVPSASTFQANTKKLSAKTWEAINRVLFGWAEANGIEKGRKVSEMVRNP